MVPAAMSALNLAAAAAKSAKAARIGSEATQSAAERAAAAVSATTAVSGNAVLTPADGALRNQINGLEKVVECVHCTARRRDTVLLPCRHMILCSHCAAGVTTCPVRGCSHPVVKDRMTVIMP